MGMGWGYEDAKRDSSQIGRRSGERDRQFPKEQWGKQRKIARQDLVEGNRANNRANNSFAETHGRKNSTAPEPAPVEIGGGGPGEEGQGRKPRSDGGQMSVNADRPAWRAHEIGWRREFFSVWVENAVRGFRLRLQLRKIGCLRDEIETLFDPAHGGHPPVGRAHDQSAESV